MTRVITGILSERCVAGLSNNSKWMNLGRAPKGEAIHILGLRNCVRGPELKRKTGQNKGGTGR